jgi:hypothetical protein
LIPPGGLPPELKKEASKNSEIDPSLQKIDLSSVTIQDKFGRFLVTSGNSVLRDCGADRATAQTVLMVIQQMGFTHHGSIAGANPPFEYWLVEDQSMAKKGLVSSEAHTKTSMMIPINAEGIHAKKVSGAWIVTDGGRVLYNFGQLEENARKAVEVLKKYGFNALGIVGQPVPIMTYPTKAAGSAITAPAASRQTPNVPFDPETARFLQNGFFIPQVGYLGHRKPFDLQQLELKRGREWVMLAGPMTLFNFGSDENTGRQVLRAFQDWHVNEYVEIGNTGYRLFLAASRVPNGRPFNARSIDFRNEDLKVVKDKEDHYWLQAGSTQILDCGKSDKDADLLLTACRYFQVDCAAKYGNPRYGEHLFLIRAR